uniref:Uncharacterized protein n=1 Tax=Chinchilla lanigera TaxID=34839 RepID=A0A8C2UWU3_CHILA
MTLGKNISTMTGFILLGFSEPRVLQGVLFVVFRPHLHPPCTSSLESCPLLRSHIPPLAPNMLCDFLWEPKAISFVGCAAQFFFFAGMGGAACCLPAAMAYDRCAATSSPLLYPSLMPPDTCLGMAMAACAAGLLTGLAQTSSIFQLRFCGPRVMNHVFCDLPPLLALACSSTFLGQVANLLVGCAAGGTSALLVLVSYGYVIVAVMKIHTAQGRMKAFNTRAPHLTAVLLFYGSGLFSHLHSSSGSSRDKDKVVSMLCGAVSPMLNPITYSLRNKDIKDALQKLKGWRKHIALSVL